MKFSFKKTSIVLAAILILSTALLSGCKKSDPVELTDGFNFGTSFGLAPTADFVNECRDAEKGVIDTALVEKALAEGASQDDIKAAVIHLFFVGEANEYSAGIKKGYANRSDGSGDALTTVGSMEIGGAMTVRSYSVHNAGSWYSASASVITQGHPDNIRNIAQGMLNNVERKFYDKSADTYYKQQTKGHDGKANFDAETGLPVGEFTHKKTINTKYTGEEGLAVYKVDNAVARFVGEKTNADLTADAIEDCKIEKTDYGTYKYSFKFIVSEEANRTYLNLGRSSLAKSANAYNDQLYYNKLDFVIEQWDSGFFRTTGTEESWNATIQFALGIKPTADTMSSNICVYSWDMADCSLDGFYDTIVAAAGEKGFTEAEAK